MRPGYTVKIALSAMFLTTCAVCAKALDDDVEAPRQCEPCGTRYCGEECEREGRDHDCDAIVRAGGAEAAYVSRTSADAVADNDSLRE